jgi:hypothetical protein
MDLTAVETAIGFMRKHGVVRLKAEGIEIDLGSVPMTIPPTASASGPWPVETTEKCPCGHPVEEHGDAGCFNGCPEERCVPPADAEKA